MANCKRCNTEDSNKTRVFICESCKIKECTCPVCGGKKSKAKYKLCTKCLREDKDYRNALSKALKGKEPWSKGLSKDTDKRIAKMGNLKKGVPLSKNHKSKISKTLKENKTHIGVNNPFYGKTHSNSLKEKWSKKRKGKNIHTEESKKKLREGLLKRYENGEIYSQPRSSWYEYKGIKCQGKSELKWLKENFNLVENSRLHFKTPYGLYIGDFKIKDTLIEIKSLYTFNRMIEKENQIKKILWVNKYIIPVEFAVDHKNKFHTFKCGDEGVDWAMKKSKEIDKEE